MRVLVTGAAGMLGHALVPALADAGYVVVATDIDTAVARPWGERGPTIAELDVRYSGDVLDAVEVIRPDLIVHLAAETSLEICELQPDHAVATNMIGTQNVALAAQRAEIPLAYISTAGVFDGMKTTAYDELDAASPINRYGSSKYAGEHIVATLVDRYFIARSGWMVGGGKAKDHKFVSHMLRQLEDGQTRLFAVGDKLGTPTYAVDFSACFVNLLASDLYGLYHMSGSGSGSRYDVAAKILEVLGRDDVELIEVGSEHFEAEYFAPRPRCEIMRNLALELHGMDLMRPWQESVTDYLMTQFPEFVATPRVAEI
jgi:dTDP-4-dehydrorhamnose reductase